MSSESHHAPDVRKTHENTIVNMNEHSNPEGGVDNIAFLYLAFLDFLSKHTNSMQTGTLLERTQRRFLANYGGVVAVTSSAITGKGKIWNLDFFYDNKPVQVCHVCF